MFRTPRQNVRSSDELYIKPSVGRPPTPPKNSKPPTTTGSKEFFHPHPSTNNIKSYSSKKMASAKKIPGKFGSKSNASILNFFKKVDSPIKDDPIFVSDSSQPFYASLSPRSRGKSSPVSLEILYRDDENFEFQQLHETPRSVKRQKIDNQSPFTGENQAHNVAKSGLEKDNKIETKSKDSGSTVLRNKPKSKRKGPFLSDSDTDDENEFPSTQSISVKSDNKNLDILPSDQYASSKSPSKSLGLNDIIFKELSQNESVGLLAGNVSKTIKEKTSAKPLSDQKVSPSANPLKQENEVVDIDSFHETFNLSALSRNETIDQEDEWGDFDKSDFQDNDLLDGEEFIGKKFIEEQARLESEDRSDENQEINPNAKQNSDIMTSSACPICNISLSGISSDLASRHVNGCLDGNIVKVDPKTIKPDLMPLDPEKKPVRRSAIPRPGQANPFELATPDSAPVTVFSKIMAGKAEDAAWTNAASSERSSKGKPAYQRTCPFYKIIPGFSICVDAFRYGAVEGCVAYFLSHFHSDHYIGLTSSWSNGPIYCSKVTGNLVKQQLRVDSKYVVSLEFEKRYTVPDTSGVTVSMISANHCPGSSLFLFERTISKEKTSRIQRVLHCGDFRACPAHINHPLLMPDIVDSITGQSKQQKIDVCYLDTTYLNSRYAFPPQKQVIQACAEMCLSLKKERAEEGASWDNIKRERLVSNYFNSGTVKSKSDSVAAQSDGNKNRGRLLIVCGTYSIGKELICLGIARALDCKIFAPARKMRICAALEDKELMGRLTSDPREAQIHMQMLMEIRPETLQEYLNSYKPHFSRIVGFRPSGWTYKPPTSRAIQSATVSQILTSPSWRSSFSFSDLTPQRGSTREASCFGVPYSEHSSFRELALFICALRIEKVIPTVNIGSASGRAKMQAWIDKWQLERRKNGPIKIGDGENEVQW